MADVQKTTETSAPGSFFANEAVLGGNKPNCPRDIEKLLNIAKSTVFFFFSWT
jgi:hypothetical protein